MSKVFAGKISPETVIEDYQSLLRLAGAFNNWDKSKSIVIKINLSWTKFYPACSTPPWQLEGVVKYLLVVGYSPEKIIPVENRTVVTNVYEGAKNHGWLKILDKYGIKMRFLPDEAYIEYRPKAKMLVLDRIFPNGIVLPKLIVGKPIIHLPTMKTHVFTVTTGAIKNYFGMLNVNRHFAHRHIHETVVDLLQIQKEIHPQIFGIMDGAVIGSGPGPRAMDWIEAGYALMGSDLVALDATAAKMMGFNPLIIPYLKMAKELGLGENDPLKIEIAGEDISQVNFHFKSSDTLASRGQKFIYHRLPKWAEKLLLQTVIAPWSYFASKFYFDYFWFNFIGLRRLKRFLSSDWGHRFLQYTSNRVAAQSVMPDLSASWRTDTEGMDSVSPHRGAG